VDDAEQRRMETWKVHFDFLKHITTLDTASALIVVTIYRDINASFIATVVALSLFGLSLGMSVFGMVRANEQIQRAPSEPRRKSKPSALY
jgi:hypothetical protein